MCFMDPVECALRGAWRVAQEATRKYDEHAAKLRDAGATELDPHGLELLAAFDAAHHDKNVFTNMSFRCEDAAWRDLEQDRFDPNHVAAAAAAIANYRPHPRGHVQHIHSGDPRGATGPSSNG